MTRRNKLDTIFYAVMRDNGQYLCLQRDGDKTGLLYQSRNLQDARIYDTAFVAKVVAELYEGDVVPLSVDKKDRRNRLTYSKNELAFINRT